MRLDADATLTLANSGYRATTIVGIDTVIAWDVRGPSQNGVTLGGAGQPLTFGPAGLAMGVSNRTITVTKGSAVRRIVMSSLGRLTY